MPLLRNPDKSKLSKRKNPTSVSYYERAGFLPETVVNYLGRMGWSMPDEREKFTLAEMIENFDILRVSLGGPIFDVEKLKWLNGLWIRENLSAEEFVERAKKWAFNEKTLLPLVELVQGRVETLTDILPLSGFMFSGMLNLSQSDFEHKKLEVGQVKRVLQFTLWTLEAQRHWSKDTIFTDIKLLAKVMALKLGEFMQPIFVAIAGTPDSWSVVESMDKLGPDMTRARLRHAVNVLEGFSKKETKKVEKEYQAILKKLAEEESEK
jgi:glutamyl-tRNA synthetase